MLASPRCGEAEQLEAKPARRGRDLRLRWHKAKMAASDARRDNLWQNMSGKTTRRRSAGVAQGWWPRGGNLRPDGSPSVVAAHKQQLWPKVQ